ncbi:MAG: hypothetical protein PVI30_21895 [Myxococcales bacterium]|jgi:hypothetical protein
MATKSKGNGSDRSPRDVALLTGPTPDGEGAQLLRLKEGTLMAGELRPMRDGQPLNGAELVRLQPMHPEVPVCAVETLHAPSTTPSTDGVRRAGRHDGGRKAAARPSRRQGPARVSNDAYRKNWSAVFGARRKKADTDYSLN